MTTFYYYLVIKRFWSYEGKKVVQSALTELPIYWEYARWSKFWNIIVRLYAGATEGIYMVLALDTCIKQNEIISTEFYNLLSLQNIQP